MPGILWKNYGEISIEILRILGENTAEIMFRFPKEIALFINSGNFFVGISQGNYRAIPKETLRILGEVTTEIPVGIPRVFFV